MKNTITLAAAVFGLSVGLSNVAQAEDPFKMIDLNNDGMVTAMELNHAKQAMEFARLDKNNDGVLSPAEVNSRSKMIMELLNRNN